MFPLSDSSWQVPASAAPKFQRVWDLLEETVAGHVQFRAGALPLPCWSSEKHLNQMNSSVRWFVLGHLQVGAAVWFCKEISKIRNARRVPGRAQEGQATGLDENHYWFMWKKGCFLCHDRGLENKRYRYSVCSVRLMYITDELLKLYFMCQVSILQMQFVSRKETCRCIL